MNIADERLSPNFQRVPQLVIFGAAGGLAVAWAI